MFRRSFPTALRFANVNSASYSTRTVSKVAQVIPSFSAPIYQKEHDVKILANGVKVTAIEAPSHMVSLSLFVRGGSRFETEANNGANFLLQHAAFSVGLF